MAVSFENDIKPLFAQFKGPMMWRFDLTVYETVKANAALIYSRISDPDAPMPPPPFPPLTQAQIKQFKQWMDDNYQP